jgi:penicillin-binding protein 1A
MGSVLLSNPYSGEAVISEESASVMNLMLQNVVKEGTAKTLSLPSRVDCAGKTGATQNNYDRWYVGYTPYYIGGVWYGYEYPEPLSGSNRCLTIWDEVMTEIHAKRLERGKGEETLRFEISNRVIPAEYCKDSGLPTTYACDHDPRGNRREIGYFIEGREPSGLCDRHVPVAYDRVEGGVCTQDICPEENRSYIGLIFVERSFPIEIYVTDAQYVWRKVGEGILPETSPTRSFFSSMLKAEEYCGISKGAQQYNRACRKHVRIIG